MVFPGACRSKTVPPRSLTQQRREGLSVLLGGEAWARFAQARRTIWFMPGRLLLGPSEEVVPPASAARRRQRLLVPRRRGNRMFESLGIWRSRLSRLQGGVLAHFKEICAKRAVFWPWADRVLVLLTFIIAVVRLYGQPLALVIVGVPATLSL